MLAKCVERFCELANNKTDQLYKVSSPCLDDHQIKKEELENKSELSEVCSHIVLLCLYLARIGGLDICGKSTNWHDLSQNGQELSTDDWHDQSPTLHK